MYNVYLDLPTHIIHEMKTQHKYFSKFWTKKTSMWCDFQYIKTFAIIYTFSFIPKNSLIMSIFTYLDLDIKINYFTHGLNQNIDSQHNFIIFHILSNEHVLYA